MKNSSKIDFKKEYYYLLACSSAYLSVLEANAKGIVVPPDTIKTAHALHTEALARSKVLKEISPPDTTA